MPTERRNKRGNGLPIRRQPVRTFDRTRIERKPKKSAILQNPNLPKIRVRGNVIFILPNDKRRIIIPWRMILTFVLIFVGALGSALAAARISAAERAIISARSQRIYYQTRNTTMQENVSDRYPSYEIEQRAIDMGMSRPDPARIVNIYVPRHSSVVLNTDEYAMPRYNYFWNEIVTFVTGIFDSVFGG